MPGIKCLFVTCLIFSQLRQFTLLLVVIHVLMQGINKKKLYELLTSADTIKQANFVVDENHMLVEKALNIKADDNYVVANGRVSKKSLTVVLVNFNIYK